MLRLAFDFIITWRETRTRPNAYSMISASTLSTKLFIVSFFAISYTNDSTFRN